MWLCVLAFCAFVRFCARLWVPSVSLWGSVWVCELTFCEFVRFCVLWGLWLEPWRGVLCGPSHIYNTDKKLLKTVWTNCSKFQNLYIEVNQVMSTFDNWTTRQKDIINRMKMHFNFHASAHLQLGYWIQEEMTMDNKGFFMHILWGIECNMSPTYMCFLWGTVVRRSACWLDSVSRSLWAGELTLTNVVRFLWALSYLPNNREHYEQCKLWKHYNLCLQLHVHNIAWMYKLYTNICISLHMVLTQESMSIFFQSKLNVLCSSSKFKLLKLLNFPILWLSFFNFHHYLL